MSDAHALFHSTHHALWAEQVLVAAGVPARMVPVPRHLSSDCGYCVRFDRAHADRAAALLRLSGVEVDRIVPAGSGD